MSHFAHNIELLRVKNGLRNADINKMFGWSSNAFSFYQSNPASLPDPDKWTLLVQKTGIPQSTWIHTRLTDDEVPVLKFTTERKQQEYRILFEDAEEYGPLIKLDIKGLLSKLADMEMRMERIEKALHIAKE